MALKCEAFLAIWHEIDTPQQEEYMEWHTREHIPERIPNPGFSLGKRLINHDLNTYRYGTIYCGDELEVFCSSSSAYLKRPNNPPEWTLRVQPAFRNFLRIACECLADALLKIKGACCTHVGLAHVEVTDVKTRETELRPKMNEKAFDALVVVEGSRRPELEAVVGEIKNTITSAECDVGSPVTLVHDLAYRLGDNDTVQGRETK